MEAARAAVQNFTSRKGHTTEVDELVQHGVTSEAVKPHRHEETTQAVDREVHQHHHHTTVQPIQHQEVLPEKHTHNLHPTEEREYIHGDPEEHKARLAKHAAQFKDSSVVHETTRSEAIAPTVQGEHVHHHVHEIVQPIVHKETVQPEVVHTTHPVHEVHHHHATHHGMSALPMKTLDEFKGAGGILTGSKSSSHEKYDGEPRPYNKELETTMDKLGLGHHGSSGTTGTTGTSGHQYNGSGVSGVGSSGRDSGIGSSPREQRAAGFGTGIPGDTSNHGYGSSGMTGNTSGRNTSDNYGSSNTRGTDGLPSINQRDGDLSQTTSSSGKKPGLMSRLNPMKDTDGDGKKGIMD